MKAAEFIHGNWGLKLLALILAVVVYYTIQRTINNHALGGHALDIHASNGPAVEDMPAQGGKTDDRGTFQQPQ